MMNYGMTVDQAREALEALAVGALDPAERQAVLSVVEQHTELQLELQSLAAAASELSYLVRPLSMATTQRDRVRARLIGRAGGDRGQAPMLKPSAASTPILMPFTTHPTTEHVHMPRSWMSSPASWIAMAATIIAIASGAVTYQAMQERDKFASLYASIAGDRVSGAPAVDSLRSVVLERDKMIANLTGPLVTVVNLSAGKVPAISARMFWDQSVNAWTFVAHNVPAPASGRTYQLWLVTNSTKISAGVFKPERNGDVVVRATYALPREALAAVAVSDEPSEGSVQPTTVPFIVGARSEPRARAATQ